MLENIFDTLSKGERERLNSLTESLAHTSEYAERTKAPIKKYLIVVTSIGVSGAIALIFPLTILIGGIVIGLFYFLRIASHRWKLIEAFEKDYPAFLLSLASAVKTGLDPFDAMLLCGEMFSVQSPIRQEIIHVEQAVRNGRREDQAIREFGAVIPHPDVRLFHDAFIIARQCGASISPVLQRLAKFTRQRQSFRRKVSAAVAMQRLSSYGIIGCCIVIAGIQCVASPQSILLACSERMGQVMLGIGVTLMAMGMFWMLYLTRKRV